MTHAFMRQPGGLGETGRADADARHQHQQRGSQEHARNQRHHSAHSARPRPHASARPGQVRHGHPLAALARLSGFEAGDERVPPQQLVNRTP